MLARHDIPNPKSYLGCIGALGANFGSGTRVIGPAKIPKLALASLARYK